MKNEYKYQGIMASGKGVQGIVIAQNKKKATELINKIANKYKISIKSVKKIIFIYS